MFSENIWRKQQAGCSSWLLPSSSPKPPDLSWILWLLPGLRAKHGTALYFFLSFLVLRETHTQILMKTRGARCPKKEKKMVLHPPVVTDEKRNSLAHGNVFWLPLLCLIKKAHAFFFLFFLSTKKMATEVIFIPSCASSKGQSQTLSRSPFTFDPVSAPPGYERSV